MAGPFTEEEDALIVQQVADLGIQLDNLEADGDAEAGAFPAGFWEELSAMLNRPPEILRARVRNIRRNLRRVEA